MGYYNKLVSMKQGYDRSKGVSCDRGDNTLSMVVRPTKNSTLYPSKNTYCLKINEGHATQCNPE